MPTQSFNTTMGLSADDFIADLGKVVGGLSAQADAMQSVVASAAKFNDSFQVTGAKMKVQLDANRQLIASYKELTQAQLAAGKVPAFIDQSTGKSFSRQVTVGEVPAREKTTLDPANIAAGTAAAERARQQFPIPSTASIAQLAKYESAIGRIQSLITNGKVSGSRFNEIFDALKGNKDLSKLNLNIDDQKLVTALGTISKGFNTATDSAQKFNLSLRDVLRIVQALFVKEFVSAFVSQMQTAITEATKFQIKISEIRTLATENQASFQSWSQSIARVSDALGIPQIEVAKAAYEGLSAQIVSGREETEQLITQAGRLARVGVSSIAESGKVLASVFNAYGINATRAEEISAKLFVAVDRGNFTIAELGNHLGRITGTASALGVSLDDALGALTTLSRTSNPADSITQLGNVFLKLQNPTAATTKFLKTLGFETGQTAIQALGFVGVLKEIEKATHGDASALAEFGGELRAIRGLTGLTTGGKGRQFQQDVNAIKGVGLDENGQPFDPVKKFNEADIIRGESPGDKLTKEFNKIKNFFTNEFGQSILGVASKVSDSFGGLFNVVKIGSEIIVRLGTVVAVYVIGTKTLSAANAFAAASYAALGVKTQEQILAQQKLNAEMTTTQKVAGGVASAFSALIKVATFAVLLDEIIKVNEELDKSKKRSTDFEDVLSKLNAAREGKDPNDPSKTQGETKFQKSTLAESSAFASTVDNLFKPLLLKQAEAGIQAHKLLDNLREKGKETAVQLQVAFKATTDGIGNTIHGYSENITKANKAIEDSKKHILSVRESVQGIINDLKLDFANQEQKFILRSQEIQRLEAEARKLSDSDNPEDITKAQRLGLEALQKRKDLAKAAGDAQVEAERNRRTAFGFGAGSAHPDNRPIEPDLSQHFQELQNSAKFLEDLDNKVISNSEKKKKDNEDLIAQEKERERLLTKRVQDLLKIQIIESSGKINPEFQDKTGKFDDAKFNKTLEDKTKLVTNQLTEQEKRTGVLSQLEQFRLNQLKQQRAELEAQKIAAQQLASGQTAAQAKKEFEEAAKARIKASGEVDKAGRGLDVSGDFIKQITDAATRDSRFGDIGEGDNRATRFGERLLNAIGQAIDKVEQTTGGPKSGALSQRGKIAEQNQELIKSIQDLSVKFKETQDKATGRDVTGKLTGTAEDIEQLKILSARLGLATGELVGKFTGQANNDAFAPPGGASLGEQRNQRLDAINSLGAAIAQEKAQEARQNALVNDLRQLFGPQEFAAAQQTSALVGNTSALEQLTRELQARPIAVPANVPAVIPGPGGGGGFHTGGLIKGPSGRDNLLIRAEANEFVMSQAATRRWLPQLIAMNGGRNPRLPGRYHEGGIVQTTVGDVNVTITGPSSPVQDVKAMGRAIKREIRRGNLDLSSQG